MVDGIEEIIPGEVNTFVHETREEECSTTGRDESVI
jgi:hypothetical protein